LFCEVASSAFRGALIGLVPAVLAFDVIAIHVTPCHLHADVCASERRECGHASQL
jgi:hypothetical protein